MSQHMTGASNLVWHIVSPPYSWSERGPSISHLEPQLPRLYNGDNNVYSRKMCDEYNWHNVKLTETMSAAVPVIIVNTYLAYHTENVWLTS